MEKQVSRLVLPPIHHITAALSELRAQKLPRMFLKHKCPCSVRICFVRPKLHRQSLSVFGERLVAQYGPKLQRTQGKGSFFKFFVSVKLIIRRPLWKRWKRIIHIIGYHCYPCKSHHRLILAAITNRRNSAPHVSFLF